MHRVTIKKPGGFNRLLVEEAPDPTPKSDEVVVDVAYAGVNYADCIVRMGYYKSARKVGYPITPGFEFSGRVAAIGSNSTKFHPGQEVFGVSFFNSYATKVCVPENQLFRVPKELSLVQAATFPVVFITGWYAIKKLSNTTAGQTVLIHSAAGGIGSALAQIASLLGCNVVGVVGLNTKVDQAKSMGCDLVIDKSKGTLWVEVEKQYPRGVDAIFDSTGVETLQESYNHLAPTGRLITFGFHSMFSKTRGMPNAFELAWKYFRTPRLNPIHMADENKSVMAFNLSFLFHKNELLQEGVQELLGWLAEGKIYTLPVEEYALHDVVLAHKKIESGKTIGKLALKM